MIPSGGIASDPFVGLTSSRLGSKKQHKTLTNFPRHFLQLLSRADQRQREREGTDSSLDWPIPSGRVCKTFPLSTGEIFFMAASKYLTECTVSLFLDGRSIKSMNKPQTYGPCECVLVDSAGANGELLRKFSRRFYQQHPDPRVCCLTFFFFFFLPWPFGAKVDLIQTFL